VGATLTTAPVLVVVTAASDDRPSDVGAVLERLRLALQGHGLGVAVAPPGEPPSPAGPGGSGDDEQVVGILACGWAPDEAHPVAGAADVDPATTPPTAWR
jgi:hypothetical protein